MSDSNPSTSVPPRFGDAPDDGADVALPDTELPLEALAGAVLVEGAEDAPEHAAMSVAADPSRATDTKFLRVKRRVSGRPASPSRRFTR